MINTASPEGTGAQVMELIRTLYPICRSITGDGLRQSLGILREQVPLEIREVSSGTRVFDWEVPKEWNIRDAFIANGAGERVVDFSRSNLHVVSYSVPIRRRMTLQELRPHLHTLPDHPDWVPYRTSYDHEAWGFCLSQSTLESMEERQYEVVIESSLEPGAMSYGEFLIPGEEETEVLVSTHICHPSLCNDNLSGVAVATLLARILAGSSPRYSYRFLFLPGTIGAIAWLALNESRVSRIHGGLVLSCLGDSGPVTYKRSRQGNTSIDRAASHVLAHSGRPHEIRPFSPYGYDERQYCSPGFDLPVGALMRTPWGEFPEYHTSADDLSLVQASALEDALNVCLEVFDVLEGDRRYRNLSPKGEPRLGPRGLWEKAPDQAGPSERTTAILWVLNLSDGRHSLLEIAQEAGLPFALVRDAAGDLVRVGLLAPGLP